MSGGAPTEEDLAAATAGLLGLVTAAAAAVSTEGGARSETGSGIGSVFGGLGGASGPTRGRSPPPATTTGATSETATGPSSLWGRMLRAISPAPAGGRPVAAASGATPVTSAAGPPAPGGGAPSTSRSWWPFSGRGGTGSVTPTETKNPTRAVRTEGPSGPGIGPRIIATGRSAGSALIATAAATPTGALPGITGSGGGAGGDFDSYTTATPTLDEYVNVAAKAIAWKPYEEPTKSTDVTWASAIVKSVGSRSAQRTLQDHVNMFEAYEPILPGQVKSGEEEPKDTRGELPSLKMKIDTVSGPEVIEVRNPYNPDVKKQRGTVYESSNNIAVPAGNVAAIQKLGLTDPRLKGAFASSRNQLKLLESLWLCGNNRGLGCFPELVFLELVEAVKVGSETAAQMAAQRLLHLTSLGKMKAAAEKYLGRSGTGGAGSPGGGGASSSAAAPGGGGASSSATVAAAPGGGGASSSAAAGAPVVGASSATGAAAPGGGGASSSAAAAPGGRVAGASSAAVAPGGGSVLGAGPASSPSARTPTLRFGDLVASATPAGRVVERTLGRRPPNRIGAINPARIPPPSVIGALH